jgi:cytochrome oxidase Cu insertion factor (SCO1/SenC/PrrC family)
MSTLTERGRDDAPGVEPRAGAPRAGDPPAGEPPDGARAAHDRRQRRLLIGVALMFFAPLGLSFLLYYGHGWHPGRHVNQGELVQPPLPLPAATLPLVSGGETDAQVLRGKWTVVYVRRGRCEEKCLRHLYDTRQVRTALDRDMNRVQRMFIADADCCDMPQLRELHPDLIIVRAGPPVAPLLALLPAVNSDRMYLIDPLGNLMMFYQADSKPKGMLEDMKRLLRLSQIG